MSDGSLPLPAFTSWPTFPFEGDLRVKKLDDPVYEEPSRHGENPDECSACLAPDTAYVWVSERWRVRALDRPTGLPVVLILESRSHLDLGDLPNLLAAELGVLTVRLERAIRSLDGVARVHVNRWGDGSAHLHVWFLARPIGRLQLRGTFLSLWDDILPRIPESEWRENLALVAAWLAEFGGRSLAEPPHIDWKAPGLLNLPPEATAGSDEAPVSPDASTSTGGPDDVPDKPDEPSDEKAVAGSGGRGGVPENPDDGTPEDRTTKGHTTEHRSTEDPTTVGPIEGAGDQTTDGDRPAGSGRHRDGDGHQDRDGSDDGPVAVGDQRSTPSGQADVPAVHDVGNDADAPKDALPNGGNGARSDKDSLPKEVRARK